MSFLKNVLLVLLLACALWCSLFFGYANINYRECLDSNIFMNLRLPRTLLCLVCGLLLSLSGACFQLFFRNPLAEPGIMGLSAGATLGAVCASIFGFSGLAGLSILNAGSFAGALIAGIIICMLSLKSVKANASAMLIISGTALGTLYSAVTSILLSVHSTKIQSMYMWMLGSFNGRGWNELLAIAVPSFISLVILLASSGKLDMLASGENMAYSFGVNVKSLRILVLASGSLAVSCAVCAGGTIGFVGLMAPHAARKLFGPKSKCLLPASMLLGASLMLFSDTIARIVIKPAELPVGTITAVLGVPFFISLLFGEKK